MRRPWGFMDAAMSRNLRVSSSGSAFHALDMAFARAPISDFLTLGFSLKYFGNSSSWNNWYADFVFVWWGPAAALSLKPCGSASAAAT